jgi:hypothetical protein
VDRPVLGALLMLLTITGPLGYLMTAARLLSLLLSRGLSEMRCRR